MQIPFYVSYRQSQIHCLRWGRGEKILICLHGFGEAAGSFLPIVNELESEFTIIAVDLPMHGKTVWKEGMICLPEDIVGIIDKIPGLQNATFSLAGYSMGGRVALSVYEYVPHRVQHLVLLAPDGIKVNFWYWLATQTHWGNMLFKSVMRKPDIFFTVTKTLKNWRMINLGIYNYVHQYLKQKDKRIQLYTVWTTMRKLRPDIQKIKALIPRHNTRVTLFYGRHDRVIRHTTGTSFRKGLEACCTLHILSCGHRLLQEKNARTVAAVLTSLHLP